MEIQDIKSRLSILAVLKHYGLKPNKNSMLKCPFHEDDQPRIKIYPNTNTFNCFGCGRNGDQIEFCTLKEGSKHRGVFRAAELAGELMPTNGRPKRPTNPLKKDRAEILTKVFESFKNGLHNATRAKEYLQGRKPEPRTMITAK